MSVTTHTSTIREYVKNHTKDDIALFFGHQFVAKDAEIERMKSRVELLSDVADELIRFTEHVYDIERDLRIELPMTCDLLNDDAFILRMREKQP